MSNGYRYQQEGGLIEESVFRDLARRYEKIRTQIFAEASVGVRYVADRIVNAIADYCRGGVNDEFLEPRPFVLALTTGRTPMELYRELVRRYEAGEVSFANVAVCSLDEFFPLDPDNPHSRNYAIR